jgi:DNA-binding IclR family transcriptional regulator
MADERASGVQRAIAILTALGAEAAAGRNGVGVVEIAALVGREKSQVSRTLKALAATGMVDRDPQTRAYRLGWRLYTLAAVAADQHLLLLAPRVLRRLVAVVGERAHLSVLEAGQVLTLASESSDRVIEGASWIGRSTPLHTTSAGRALLFAHTDDEVRALLPDASFAATGNAPRDVEDLLHRLHEARALGYVRTDEEFEAGLVAVAAPVRDFRGQIIAALNISAPKFRLGHNLDAAGKHVKAAAEALTRELSREPEPPADGRVDALDNGRRPRYFAVRTSRVHRTGTQLLASAQQRSARPARSMS